jgi:hypothetical protein
MKALFVAAALLLSAPLWSDSPARADVPVKPEKKDSCSGGEASMLGLWLGAAGVARRATRRR